MVVHAKPSRSVAGVRGTASERRRPRSASRGDGARCEAEGEERELRARGGDGEWMRCGVSECAVEGARACRESRLLGGERREKWRRTASGAGRGGGGTRVRGGGVIAAAAAAGGGAAPLDAPAAAAAPPPPLKLGKLAYAVAAGCVLRYLVPIPASISLHAWQLLSVFVTTIAGLVLEPLPVGAWAFSCLTFVVASGVLTFPAAFAAFTNEVIWLIVISFFFALGFEKTGLGSRVAVMFVSWFGKSTLGLGYSLTMSEMLLSPAIPSTTARAGGIFVPIIKSLSATAGSLPGKTAGRLGKFLVHSQLQASACTSAMFLTGAAQNFLCLNLASQLGVIVPNAFTTWFIAALVPGLVCTLISPIIVYWMLRPELTDTPEAPAQARADLEKMGPMSRDEKVMLGTMVGAIGLWIIGERIGVSSVVTAMLGLTALIFTGVLRWQDCLRCSSAWDTLLWFSVLVGMSAQLNELGIIAAFQQAASSAISAAQLSWPLAFLSVSALYFVGHYFFASQTAHTGALFAAALATMLAAGTPGVVATLMLGYITNLFGSLSHYASGQAAVYYASGYVTLPEMMQQGAVHGAVKFVLWMAISSVWLRFIGLV